MEIALSAPYAQTTMAVARTAADHLPFLNSHALPWALAGTVASLGSGRIDFASNKFVRPLYLVEAICGWARANGPESCYPAPKSTNPTYWLTKPRMPSRQDDRKQEDKGLLDEINDTILGEKERGREETDRPRYG